MILRIIDKETNLFLRDDFTFDEEKEIGLEVEPSQGLYQPKWTGQKWIENATQEYIDSLKQPISDEPTLEQKVDKHEVELATLSETIEALFGGV